MQKWYALALEMGGDSIFHHALINYSIPLRQPEDCIYLTLGNQDLGGSGPTAKVLRGA